MPERADVFRRAGGESLQRFGQDRRPSPRRALDASVHGRTEACGGHLWPCDHWGQAHAVYHACRHRRGPTWQRLDPEAWLAERRQARLPVPSVPVVWTLPQALRARVRSHQKDLYDSVLRAAAPALITLAADPHAVGGLDRGPGGPAHLDPGAALPAARPWPGARRRGLRGSERGAAGPPDRPRAGAGALQALPRPLPGSGAPGTARSRHPGVGLDDGVGRLRSTGPARERTGAPRRGPVGPPARPDHSPHARDRGWTGLFPLPGLPPSRREAHDPAGPGVHPPLAATRAAGGLPQGPVRRAAGVRSTVPCCTNGNAGWRI